MPSYNKVVLSTRFLLQGCCCFVTDVDMSACRLVFQLHTMQQRESDLNVWEKEEGEDRMNGSLNL